MQHQRSYEVMFIVRPDMLDEDVDKLVSGFESTVTSHGGTVKNAERMGKRRLAYTVRRFNDGNYIVLTLESDGKVIAELERRLRVSEPVIKFITVRVDEVQKRLDKIQKIRATKVRRRPEPAPGTVTAPEAAAPAAPEAAAVPNEPANASA